MVSRPYPILTSTVSYYSNMYSSNSQPDFRPNHARSNMPVESLELAIGRWSEDINNSPMHRSPSESSSVDQIPVNGTDFGPDFKQAQSSYDETDSSSAIYKKTLKDAKYRTALLSFLVVSIASALLVIGLEGFMFGALTVHRRRFSSQQRYFEISIFLALFIFAAIYQCIITVVGLVTKNMLLLSMLCIFYICMLIYTGIQYQEISRRVNLVGDPGWDNAIFATNVATIIVLAVTLLCQVLLIYFVLWRGVQWFRFKKIGASFEIKRLYSYFQVHRSLLLFDLFFFLGFTVQFIVIMISNRTSIEFILTCVMLPLTVLVLIASDFAASREWYWLTILTILCFLGGVSYVLFKIIRLYTKYTSAYNIAVTPGAYFPGRSSLVSFGVITLAFLCCTIAMEVVMICNYNKGLLPYVSNYFSGKSSKRNEDTIQNTETDSIIID